MSVNTSLKSLPITNDWPLPINTLIDEPSCSTTFTSTYSDNCFNRRSRWSSISLGSLPWADAVANEICSLSSAMASAMVVISPAMTSIWPLIMSFWAFKRSEMVVKRSIKLLASLMTTSRAASDDGSSTDDCKAPNKFSKPGCKPVPASASRLSICEALTASALNSLNVEVSRRTCSVKNWS